MHAKNVNPKYGNVVATVLYVTLTTSIMYVCCILIACKAQYPSPHTTVDTQNRCLFRVFTLITYIFIIYNKYSLSFGVATYNTLTLRPRVPLLHNNYIAKFTRYLQCLCFSLFIYYLFCTLNRTIVIRSLHWR